jgi:Zn-dependent protease
MDTSQIADGLIQYLMLVALLTFHEFGHAWTAMKCGDDTAKMQGRVSINPLVHIDPIGTVLLPLLMIFLPGSIGRFMIGWAKPVPVNLTNLRKRDRDEILITLAGPGMNLILAFFLVGLARVGILVHSDQMIDLCVRTAALSLLLCFFNLIPIPPLDGSHLMRWLTGMSYELYWKISQYGFLLVIVFLQLPYVRGVLASVTGHTLLFFEHIFGFVY